MSDSAITLPFDWDPDWYVRRYPDLIEAKAQGRLGDPLSHYIQYGCHEGRFPSAAAETQARSDADARALPLRIDLGGVPVPMDWPIGGEVGKTFVMRLTNGFFTKYMSGKAILDIGYRGANKDAVPILPHATGVDLDYPGYDGIRLPFADGSADTVFASHVLEHVSDAQLALRDWFRVIRTGGFIVCIVPHQFLYERRRSLPSDWSGEHLRFYSPATLLCEVEEALEPNSYRVRHLADNDFGYVYAMSPDHHPAGCYEIELVVEKIEPPLWRLR
ncbi:MAG: methyltransferase domain-containing protein [Acetobacteraceae bacterium]